MIFQISTLFFLNKKLKMLNLKIPIYFLLFLVFLSCDKNKNLNEQDFLSTQLISGVNKIFIDQNIDGKFVSRVVYIKTPVNFDQSIIYPIVFVFHGAGGNARQGLNNWNLNQLIDTGEFIGVYPNGHSNNADGDSGFWNLGNEDTNADDVEFVNLIMEELKKYSEININRVYAIGFSNGSGMVNLLGKRTTHFNAIASLFSQQLITIGNINASKSLSVFQVSGEVDQMIPLNGGKSPVGEFMSAENSALNWVNQFNCSNNFIEESLEWGNTVLNSFTYSKCDDDHQIKYLIALETGHGWNDNQARNISFNEIWNFFKLH